MALGETLLIGEGSSSNYILKDGPGFDLDIGLSAMAYNYEVTFNVFEPKFALNYTDITEDGLAGVINVGGYVRDNDWNAALDDNGDVNLIYLIIVLRAQTNLVLRPMKGTHGFEGYFQELQIAPTQTDTTFYYFDSFTTYNANIYTYNVHDDDNLATNDEYLQRNI